MSLPWSTKGVKTTPVAADEVLLLDSEDANPSTQNKRARLDTIEINPGEANTSSNSGSGNGWAQAKVGPDLPFKSLITTAPIVTTVNTNDLTLILNPLVNADISATALIEFSKLENLTDTNILVGNAVNKAAGVALSGDATIANTGVLTIGNNTITDDKIAAQTTTKITTTNKSLLNSEIVYTDQTNTFGAFAQIFPNTQLQVLNPAETQSYSFTTSAITAPRTVTLPLLLGNDEFVFVSHIQSLANKTLVQPIITDYTNATHDHSDTINGGNLTNSALTPGVFSAITGLGTQTQILDTGGFTMTGLPTPINDSEAAPKIYVDDSVSGLSWKSSAKLATVGDITLSGNQTIDGVLTVDGDRVLVKDQTSSQFNGLYNADAGAWTRTTDADTEADLLNMSVFIQQGTVNDDTSWVLVTDAPIVVDTTPLDYVQVSGGFASPLTTKGDLLGYDTGDNRIPVGSNGQVLTANSADSIGVEWATPISGVSPPFLDTDPLIKGVDDTKELRFEIDGFTASTLRVLTPPDADGIIVLQDLTQTLTNKTLTAPIIATIVNSGTLTLPTGPDTLVGRDTTDTLTNKTLTAPVISTIVNTGTLTLPISTDTLIGKATTDILTNKTIDANGTGNVITNIGASEVEVGIITGQTLKATPVVADQILIADSVSGLLRRTTLTDLIGSGEVFTWSNDHSMATFKLTASAANDVILNAPTGQTTNLQVAGTTEYTFGATEADFGSNNVTSAGIISFTDENTSIEQNATNLQLDVATGGSLVSRINNITEYTFDVTTANWNGNNLVNVNYIDLDRITIPANPAVDHARLYLKQIDADNDGIFTLIKKAGAFTEVQVA